MDILPILSTLRRHKVTAVLLVLEIALTCAIVSNAVFLIRERLARMDIASGIAENELVYVQTASSGASDAEPARMQEDLAALRRIPGVREAALVNQLPISNLSSTNGGIMLDPQQTRETVSVSEYMGENLLPTLGIRRVAGRDFEPDEFYELKDAVAALHAGDMRHFPHVVLMTRTLAERLWPGQQALGREFYMGTSITFRVVGIIDRLTRPDLRDTGNDYSLLFPIRVSVSDGGIFVLRCAPQDRARVLTAAVAALKEQAPNRLVLDKRSWEQGRRDYFRDDRAMAGLLLGVVIALLGVTAFGIVGLTSFWVGQRRRMIGVRRALGATRADILRYFLTENFLLAGFGIVLGLLLAFALNLALMKFYELPRLPLAYLPIGALALLLLGQLAVLGPARRAASVPPVVATRSV